MAKHVNFYSLPALSDITGYHTDAEFSFKLYYSSASPMFQNRFVGYRPEEVIDELAARLEETELRSSLATMGRIEAAFRTDYLVRCQERKRDRLSRLFRGLYNQKQNKVSLEDEIFEVWQHEHPELKAIVGHLRGAFKFRHWLAHGRYWVPKFGKWDYLTIYAIGTSVFSDFPLIRK
jgi:hypothetical protein